MFAMSVRLQKTFAMPLVAAPKASELFDLFAQR